jgi:hypothetical protein
MRKAGVERSVIMKITGQEDHVHVRALQHRRPGRRPRGNKKA